VVVNRYARREINRPRGLGARRKRNRRQEWEVSKPEGRVWIRRGGRLGGRQASMPRQQLGLRSRQSEFVTVGMRSRLFLPCLRSLLYSLSLAASSFPQIPQTPSAHPCPRSRKAYYIYVTLAPDLTPPTLDTRLSRPRLCACFTLALSPRLPPHHVVSSALYTAPHRSNMPQQTRPQRPSLDPLSLLQVAPNHRLAAIPSLTRQ
jgi:hypothetical protein